MVLTRHRAREENENVQLAHERELQRQREIEIERSRGVEINDAHSLEHNYAENGDMQLSGESAFSNMNRGDILTNCYYVH